MIDVQPLFPQVTITMNVIIDNPIVLMARVVHALRIHHIPDREVQEFISKAAALDYNNLLKVVHDTVNVISIE